MGIKIPTDIRRLQPRSVWARPLIMLFKFVGVITRPFSYRGVGSLSRYMAKFLPSIPIEVSLGNSARIEFNLLDYYWSRLIYPNFRYEPEIANLFEQSLPEDFLFIDCGANIGFWSIMVSGQLPDNRVVAIEAAPSTFEVLRTNFEINNRRFKIVQRAIADSSGQTVSFSTNTGHAAAHVVANESSDTAQRVVEVETVTIDDVVANEDDLSAHLPVVLKLDVEGFEIEALKGAMETISNRDVVVIYECHGADRDCLATKYLLDLGIFRIYAIDTGVSEVRTTSDALKIKTKIEKGYNFVAVKPSFDPFLHAATIS